MRVNMSQNPYFVTSEFLGLATVNDFKKYKASIDNEIKQIDNKVSNLKKELSNLCGTTKPPEPLELQNPMKFQPAEQDPNPQPEVRGICVYCQKPVNINEDRIQFEISRDYAHKGCQSKASPPVPQAGGGPSSNASAQQEQPAEQSNPYTIPVAENNVRPGFNPCGMPVPPPRPPPPPPGPGGNPGVWREKNVSEGVSQKANHHQRQADRRK